ncbi:hypothetical protein CERZMDRAFT_98476 [Cercospora zeae-maydis SCOH1-5]|uniref:Zn(2)-C6 fungal-type domain-containing protein n=1 Tax=Cercospora zeae-maydis SCOH1-5 TaxID=717836 RepID=A0A6A6FDX8_9PEZI|nr:hypothetical protein CERZMDRAFT_98476 [Cercospora zeae-maydis SCOH1-5]
MQHHHHAQHHAPHQLQHQQQQQQQQHHHHQHQHHQHHHALALHPPPQPSVEPHASEATLNLPPLQSSFPGMQQSHPPSYAPPPATMGNGPPPSQQHAPPYPPPPYHPPQYAPPAPMPSNVAPNGQNGVMRFPLPPQPVLDARQMSGGRHKKEIKRRTKTGCLTCRKRRIKCDEGLPTCRNCQKSKRECLGYDPIFKQQPSPANIQPAPTALDTPPNSASAAASHVSSNHYAAPPPFPGSAPTFLPAAAAAAASMPHGGEQPHFDSHYNHAAPLDPALAAGEHVSHMPTSHNTYPSSLQPVRRVRVVPVDDLCSLNDIPPKCNLREPAPPVSPAAQQEVETFFKYHYAGGLDRLFETTWYSQQGPLHLQRDPTLQDFVSQCVEQFKAREDANSRQTQSLEARLVWLLASMPRTYHRMTNGAASDLAVQELLPRLDVVENLLTGQYLDPGRVIPPPQSQPPMPPGSDSAAINQKFNERSFWHHLARFVAIRDDTTNMQRDIDDALVTMRNLLHMLENRDVLYSLAVARHFGGCMPEWHPQRHLVPSSNDPNDPVGKLRVAQQFVETEDQRGTTQVIQRICSMAIRSWILQKQ